MPDISSQDGPRGAPPKKDLPAAFREFLDGLLYANHVFEEKDDAGREGIVHACHAVARFIAVTHQTPVLAAPLLALRGALLDLEKVIANPILDTKKPMGKQSRSFIQKQVSVVAAACLDTLVEIGDPLPQAASRVAKHVLKWRGIGDHDITAKT